MGKRKRQERHSDHPQESVGATVQRLRFENEEEATRLDTRRSSTSSADAEANTSTAAGTDGWQQVDRTARKKRKKLEKNYPTISHSHHARLQSFVKISDLQNLALYFLADGSAPQWVSIQHHQHINKVVVLMVPGLDASLFDGSIELGSSTRNSAGDVFEPAAEKGETGNSTAPAAPPSSDQSRSLAIKPDDYYPVKLFSSKVSPALKPLAQLFPHIWPIKTPGDPRKMHSPIFSMLSSPIPRPKEDKNIKGPRPPVESKHWKNQRTPITDFVMTKSELSENGFVLHPAHLSTDAERTVEAARRHRNVQSAADGWVDLLPSISLNDSLVPESEVQSGSVTAGRDVYIIDCEMVSTTVDRFALARISLISWDGQVVLDELVQPPDPVKDYLTPFSGITKEMLDGVTLTLADIQARLSDLLTPRSILAGHSLDSDFRAIKITWPFVVDTTLLYPHPKGPPQKSSLKWLTQKYLGREIQGNVSKGHDSVEDARAVLGLVKEKCERGKEWGTGSASGEPIFRRLGRCGRVNAVQGKKVKEDEKNGVNGKADQKEDWELHPRKTGAMVDWVGNMHGFAASASVAVTCKSDEEVVGAVIRAAVGDQGMGDQKSNNDHAGQEDANVPPGGCDFVFGRLRELEFERGYSPRIPGLDDRPEDDHPDEQADGNDPQSLTRTVQKTVQRIQDIYGALPERTAVIVYSGSGDPRRMIELQKMQARFKEEYAVKKWDELSVQWSDTEEQALKAAVETARRGVAFIGVTPIRDGSGQVVTGERV
ncbi:hypothetical protein CAC42_7971 [Sphaceloma murrayae]|uniref:Exonuclease domain-containing protein n=1 Tax=Sphaceloma murrayae TaxID=2082308 RepID=A0A2K1QL29_9PEZI|nr:hypothetical protein CAC42_7971 [Sphaceloma murrayae]